MEIKSTVFPNPCCRCGFCCLQETCPLGQQIYEVGKHEKCPGLFFDGDMSVCQATEDCFQFNIPIAEIKEAFGIGKGCCISARAFKDGKEYDFASLPAETKIAVVRKQREVQNGNKG